MTTGERVRISKDIYSGKKQLYARAGEVVTITNVSHWPILIVEDKKGNRFSVHIHFLKY